MNNMSEKHLPFYLAWLLVNAALLLRYFSVFGLALLALLAALALYVNVLNKNAGLKIIADTLPFYLNCSVVFAFGLFVLYYFERIEFSGSLLAENLRGYDFPWDTMEGYLPALIPALAIAFLFMLIRKKFVNHPFLYTFGKYLFWSVLGYFLIRANTQNSRVLRFYVCVTLVYILIDMYLYAYRRDDVVSPRLFYILLTFGFLVSLAGFSEAMEKLANDDFGPLPLIEQYRWFDALLLFLLFAALTAMAVFQQRAENTIGSRRKDSLIFDSVLLSMFASMAPAVFVICVSPILYNNVLLILFILSDIFLVSVISRERAQDAEESVVMIAQFPIASAAFIFFVLEENRGLGVFAIAVIGALWLLWTFRKSEKVKARNGAAVIRLNIVVMICIFAVTVVKLFMTHFSWFIVIFLGAVLALFCGISVVLFRNPDIYHEKKGFDFRKIVLPALFLILCMLSFLKGGADIEVQETSPSKLEIRISGDGIEKETYCWMEDFGQIVESLGGGVETELYRDREITQKKGLLKIKAETDDGVVTTWRKWYKDPD